MTLLFVAACSVFPMEPTYLQFEVLERDTLPRVLFADGAALDEPGVVAIGPERVVRVSAGRVERSDDRGETWVDVHPSDALALDVFVAGPVVAVVESAGSPWTIQVTEDGGETWSVRTYDVEAGVGMTASPDWMMVAVGDEVVGFGLTAQRMRTVEGGRFFAGGVTAVAPNGAVLFADAPAWMPLDAIAAWTPRYRPGMLPHDRDVVLGAGLSEEAQMVGFTADSRLVVDAGGLFVSTEPLARGSDASSELLSGPGCHRALLPSFAAPEITESDERVELTNVGPAAVRLHRWRSSLDGFQDEGVAEPGETLAVTLSPGTPFLVQDLSGTCLEMTRHLFGTATYEIGR